MSEHEHMRRVPLPWRNGEEALTECGVPADPRTTLSREEMIAKVAREGQQRAALSSCMTCWSTGNRHTKDHNDILSAILREMERVQWRESPDRERLVNELRAIVSLVETHRSEFDSLVSDFSEVVRLSTHRVGRRA